ncbi:MAG: hypothetical protein ACHQXA_09815 [Gemmatimonadales bacterium]
MIVQLVAALVLAAGPAAPAAPGPCTYSRRHTIDSSSSWADQFRCYKAAGRHITFPGTSYQTNSLVGALCIQVVTEDRVQLVACDTTSGDTAIVLSYSAILYVVDDPNVDDVAVYSTHGHW